MSAVFKACLLALLLVIALSSIAHASNMPAPMMNDPKYSFMTTDRIDNFNLIYNPETVKDIRDIADMARTAHNDTDRFLGDYPYRVTIVIAGTNSEFRLIINTGNAPDSLEALNWNSGYNGLVLIKSPVMISDFKKVLTHQMARIALRSRLNTTYQSLPEWYQDGVASFLAGDITQGQRVLAATVATTGQWTSPDDLERTYRNMTVNNFYDQDYIDARAEAATLVDYIGSRYGSQTLFDIIDDYVDSGNFSQAFVNRTTLTPDGLSTACMDSLSGNDDASAGQPDTGTTGDQGGYTISPTTVPVPEENDQQEVADTTPSPTASPGPASAGAGDLLVPGILIAFNAIVVLAILVILRRNWH